MTFTFNCIDVNQHEEINQTDEGAIEADSWLAGCAQGSSVTFHIGGVAEKGVGVSVGRNMGLPIISLTRRWEDPDDLYSSFSIEGGQGGDGCLLQLWEHGVRVSRLNLELMRLGKGKR